MTPGDPQPRLTPRQRAVLQAIREHVAAHGYPPTVRHVGDTVGLASTSSVQHVLRTLEAKGYLQRVGHRGVILADVEPATLNPLAAVRAAIADQRAALDQAATDLWCDHGARALGQARIALDAIERAAGGGA